MQRAVVGWRKVGWMGGCMGELMVMVQISHKFTYLP